MLALLLFVIGLGNVGVTLLRSTIPLRIEGRVIEVERHLKKGRGADEFYLVTVGPLRLHVDQRVARQLHTGDRVTKAAWARTMRAGGREIDLRPSRDVFGMTATMPVLWLIGLVVLFWRPRAAPEP